MRNIFRSGIGRIAVCLVISALAIPCLVVGAQGADAAPTARKSVLVVFPADDSASAGSFAVTKLQSVLGDGLAATTNYRVIEYVRWLPAVTRIMATEPEKRVQPTGPFSTSASAVRNSLTISKALDAKLALVGEITRFSVTPAGAVEMTVSFQMLDVQTAATADMLVVSGTSKTSAETSGENARIEQAVQDIAAKIVKELSGREYQAAPAAQTPAVETPAVPPAEVQPQSQSAAQAPTIERPRNRMPVWGWVVLGGIAYLLADSL